MATKKETVTHIIDQIGEDSRARAMFGGYTVYYKERVVGLICDDTLFIKITERTSQRLNAICETGPPYPGAKDAFVISEDMIEDAAQLLEIVDQCSMDVKPKR